MLKFRTLMGATAIAVGVLAVATTASAQTKLRVVSTAPGTTIFPYLNAIADIINKYVPEAKAEVAAHGKATRHYVDATRGDADIFFSQPLYHVWMTKGQRVFAKTKNGPEVANKASALFAIMTAIFHPTVREESGIKSLADLKGKKVFLGPPAGGATFIARSLIEGATGLKAGKDFQVLKVGWGPGMQAFQDRQIDAIIQPSLVPGALLQQLSLTSKLRFLGIPKDRMNSPGIAKLAKLPGPTFATIPKGTYGKNQVNQSDVTSVAVWGQMGIRTGVDAGLAYKITKAFWEHIDEVHQKSAGFRDLTLKNAFRETASPIHPGAIRYYKEIGLKVPDRLILK